MKQVMDVKEASEFLTQQLGKGYSVSSIYSYIAGDTWKEGVEYMDDSSPSNKKRRIKVKVMSILKAKGVTPVA